VCDVLSGKTYGPGGGKASDDVYVDIEQTVPVISTKIQQVYHARYHNRKPLRVIDMEPDSPEQRPPQGDLPSGDRNLLDELELPQ